MQISSGIRRVRDRILNMSLVWKVAISYILVITIPFSLFAVFFYKQTANSIYQDYQKVMQSNVNYISGNIYEKVKEFEVAAELISTNESLRKYLEYYTAYDEYYDMQMFTSVGNYIEGITKFNSWIFKLYIFCNNDEISEYATILYNKKVVENNPYYQKACRLNFDKVLWEPEHAFISYLHVLYPAHTPLAPKDKVFSLYRKIMSIDFLRQTAMLQLDVKSEDLLKGIESRSESGDDLFIIADSSDRLVYCEDENTHLWEDLKSSIKTSGALSSSFKFSSGGSRYLATYETVKSLDLKVIAIIPENKIGQLIAQSMNIMVAIAVITFITLLFIIYMISILIFRRINKLKGVIKKVQAGDFDIQIPVDYMDELGQLKSAFNIMVEKINYLFNQVYKSKIAERDAALSYLQSQMNPHLLYNTLEVIRMMAEADGNSRVSNVTALLGKVLRYNITLGDLVEISKEIDITVGYVAIQNVRFNNKILLNLSIPEELKDYKIKKLIIQPLVENAISHGFSNMMEGCIVDVSVGRMQDSIVIKVADNGQGLAKERAEDILQALEGLKDISEIKVKGNGVGLFNINKRIKLYYGQDYGVNIASKPGAGTLITVTIPYILKGHEGKDQRLA